MMSDTFPGYGQTFAMMITEPNHAGKPGPSPDGYDRGVQARGTSFNHHHPRGCVR